jgi:hypothetical protein
MTELDILTDFFELMKMVIVFGAMFGIVLAVFRELLNFY